MRCVAGDARAAALARQLADPFDRYAVALSEGDGEHEREIYLRAMGRLHDLKQSVRALSKRVAEFTCAEPPRRE